MKKSSFYLQRLKNASIRELGYRFRQQLMHRRVRRLHRKKAGFIPVPACSITQVKNLVAPSIHSATAQDTVEKILQGFRFSLNGHVSEMEKFEKSCSDVFSPDIARLQKPLDVRQVWEPARLQHITLLLNWYSQNGNSLEDINVAQFVKQNVLDWIENNPFLSGAHYMCPMECGLRIPVFFYTLRLLDNLSVSEQEPILAAIYRHAWWIAGNLSLHSSRGNHTICEAIGLIFAGAVFKHTQEGHEWLSTGLSLLRDEVHHQIHNDGGPAEQSLSYHRFVLDLYWLAIDFVEINSLQYCPMMRSRLEKGESFLTCFENEHGEFPSIGDSDNAHAIAPGLSPRKSIKRLPHEGYTVFNDSGFTLISTSNSSLLTFDHGPLGMPPLYNHGHADALSITLSKNGTKFLVDPGTYHYSPEDEWRTYFKGTSAHNTVTVDSLDQAVQETGFIWSHPFDTTLECASKRDRGFIVVASHSGYNRLKYPVVHKRSILVFAQNSFIIKDTFSGKGLHDFVLNFHLHPETTVIRDGKWWVIEGKDTEIFLRLLDKDDFTIIRGQTDPVLGWYSPYYGIKVQSPVLSCPRKDFVQKVTFTTVICTEKPQEKTDYMEMAKCI